ncbi:hypothetical protein ACFWBX_00855 [Streptomyces sp. NPDC059991]|uniref:hypothetical protein n=1 Tax=Streptomyces sp. NPDC059991 TaxID=3347028 RepID=UPI003693CD2E
MELAWLMADGPARKQTAGGTSAEAIGRLSDAWNREFIACLRPDRALRRGTAAWIIIVDQGRAPQTAPRLSPPGLRTAADGRTPL